MPDRGVDFFQQLAHAGQPPCRRRPQLGSVIIDLDYVQRSWPRIRRLEVFRPAGAAVSAYDAQAINRAAPHPAAARLWEEYLFSDTGQNLCVLRGARPARMDA